MLQASVIVSSLAVIVAILLSAMILIGLKMVNVLKKRVWLVLIVLSLCLWTVGLTFHSFVGTFGMFGDPVGLIFLVMAPWVMCIIACCLGRYSYEFNFTGVPEPSKTPKFD